jgi:trehalose-6-phosphatase
MTRPLAVFAYDFDGTLAPGNMQEHAYIPDARGVTTKLLDAPS